MEKKKQKFVEAYSKTLGNITLSAKSVGVSRPTFYNWKKADKEFSDAIDDIRENEVCDFVENALMQRIQEGDTTAIIFACKTLCKNRGYVERQENVVDGNFFENAIRKLEIRK